MNSGCYDNDISKVLLSIQAIDKNKFSEIEIKKEDINFYAIKSDFGVEIVNPNNNSKLSKEMELTTVTNKNTKHMRDITDYLFNDAKKGNI